MIETYLNHITNKIRREILLALYPSKQLSTSQLWDNAVAFTKQAMHSNLKKLLKAGLLNNTLEKRDGKSSWYSLTPLGRVLIEGYIKLYNTLKEMQ